VVHILPLYPKIHRSSVFLPGNELHVQNCQCRFMFLALFYRHVLVVPPKIARSVALSSTKNPPFAARKVSEDDHPRTRKPPMTIRWPGNQQPAPIGAHVAKTTSTRRAEKRPIAFAWAICNPKPSYNKSNNMLDKIVLSSLGCFPFSIGDGMLLANCPFFKALHFKDVLIHNSIVQH
jgi:hypothetical protein